MEMFRILIFKRHSDSFIRCTKMCTRFSKRLDYLVVLAVLLSISVSSVYSADVNNIVRWSQREEECQGLNCSNNTQRTIWRPVYIRDATNFSNNVKNDIYEDHLESRSGLIAQSTVDQSQEREEVSYSEEKVVQNEKSWAKKSDLHVPVAQTVSSVQQAPEIKELKNYNNIISQYYPNGTDLTGSGSNPYPYELEIQHEPTGTDESSYLHVNDNTGEVHFEVGGIKLAVITLSVTYLLFALLFTNHNLEHSLSSCEDAYHDDTQVWHVFAENPQSPYAPYPNHGSSMQKEIFSMFTSYGRPWAQSDEDDSREMPDLSYLDSICPREAFFYGMNHQHMKAVGMVKDILMKERGPNEMMWMAKALLHSPHINPKVWYTAMMKTLHARSDMSGLIMPGPLDAMPDTFIPGHDIERTVSLYRSGKRRSRKNKKKCIRVDGSVGLDNGLENILWYFREDVMVNSHHWYWHLTFPLITTNPIDRRGELFYYTHRSMTNRYNIERLCNGMEFVKPLEVYPGAPIHEGYNAHLTDFNAGMPWTDRPPFTPLSSIFHQEDPANMFTIPLKNWLRSRDRILRSIKTGFFTTGRGSKMRIPNYEGIDILGNTLEAIDLSINPRYYDPDGYHNNGHRILGFAVDPNYQYRLPPGPMADPATAMRDPVFYRWHTNMNNIFEKYKATLKPYYPVGGDFPLLWNGVHVKEFSVVAHDGRKNQLKTFWGRRKYDLSLGLAFNRTVNDDDDDDDKPDYLKVCTTHLNHEEFEYEIVVDRKPCAKSWSNTATVRIFLSPRYDLYGRRFTVQEQRRLFVHLDLFSVELKVGKNVIRRRSIDSTLTIPWTQSLRLLQTNMGNQNSPNCGCGWPHHLLLPRGTPEGMPFDLFVMVTNGDEDFVKDEGNPFAGQCGSAFLFCGIQNRLFPDAKPMGYPFDRQIYKISRYCTSRGHSIWSKICSWIFPDIGAKYLEDYTKGIYNMAFSPLTITHIPH